MYGNLKTKAFVPRFLKSIFPANIYLFKVNNRNTRKMCKICSNFSIKIPERGQCLKSIFALRKTASKFLYLLCDVQKQPSRGVLIKSCSENIQQIYGSAPMPN